MYAEFLNAGSQIPASAQFNKTGTLGTSTKATFDQLIEDVSVANNNAPVVIMGTKTALKKVNDLLPSGAVNWADSQKEAVASTGILGNYEGTELMEVPQRFANNDTAQKLVKSDRLFIFPLVDYKPVKFVDYGETELTKTEVGDYVDDMQTYEVQRRMGIGTIITRYFGTWVF